MSGPCAPLAQTTSIYVHCCVSVRVTSTASFPAASFPDVFSSAIAQHVTSMLAAGAHDRLYAGRIILVLFYMERKNYMIKLGAGLTQLLANDSSCIFGLRCSLAGSQQPPLHIQLGTAC